jgi:hypothetical protein
LKESYKDEKDDGYQRYHGLLLSGDEIVPFSGFPAEFG